MIFWINLSLISMNQVLEIVQYCYHNYTKNSKIPIGQKLLAEVRDPKTKKCKFKINSNINFLKKCYRPDKIRLTTRPLYATLYMIINEQCQMHPT